MGNNNRTLEGPIKGPIGVFDSGVGGLTVLSALVNRHPNQHYIYLGDTARVPYGTKSQSTIEKYAHQATQCLLNHGAKTIVIACNSASAMAATSLRQSFSNNYIYDVVEPGVHATIQTSNVKHVALLATHSTVNMGTYQQLLRACRPELTISALACPLFVSLAEEGWIDGPAVEAVIKETLAPLKNSEKTVDAVILGCTHFPLLTKTLADYLGPDVAIIDSGKALANSLQASSSTSESAIDILATDSIENFKRVAQQFWTDGPSWNSIQKIDL